MRWGWHLPVPVNISRLEYAALLEEFGYQTVDQMGWFNTFQRGDDTTDRIEVAFDEWDFGFQDVLAQFRAMNIKPEQVLAAYHRLFDP